MTTGVFRYQSERDWRGDTPAVPPPVWYRGYVQRYDGNRRLRTACDDVRPTYAEAMKDATKLHKKLNQPCITKTI